MSRRHGTSDVVYDDRRERDYASSRGGGSRYEDDRFFEQEVQFRRSAPPVREREREEIDIIREDRTRAREPPAFLREDYGRTSAGPVVLRAREREDFDFIPPPAPRSRRRSPSPESDRKTERESIVIRRDREETESRPPPRRERSRERDEIIIRRDRDDTESRAPPRRERSRERDEIIIRRDRDDTESRAPPRRERSLERDEIIIRRDERERRPAPPPPPPPPPPQEDVSREEIIIRREERSSSRPAPRDDRETERIIIRRRDEDDRSSRYEPPPPPRDLDYALVRPRSRERERSMGRHDGSDSEHEVIIRREETKGRGRDETRSREEIIIRSNSRSSSRSPSPAPSMRSHRSTRSRAMPPPEPQIVYAPQIHQEVITHHKHIDHGYELAIPQRPRPISRPPSPPSPPPPPPPARDQSEERIEIRRTESRNGRTVDEDIIIDRHEGSRSVPPSEPERYEPPPPRRAPPRWRDERDIEDEAEYYNQRALERSYPGEAWHGATRDWALVDVPPGTRKVRMDGAGGGAQEISWQRYNGMRRSKFYAEADEDEAYSSVELSRHAPPPAPAPAPRPEPPPASGGDIGRRYGKTRDPKAGLWTEITKDLVIKEAITEMGYEYEETDEFYYIIAYLKYEDVARLVGLSEDIRKDRRKRVKELEWESQIKPEAPPPRRPLAIEPPAPVRSPRSAWEREDERYIEREIVYRGGRPPPPPPGWRR